MMLLASRHPGCLHASATATSSTTIAPQLCARGSQLARRHCCHASKADNPSAAGRRSRRATATTSTSRRTTTTAQGDATPPTAATTSSTTAGRRRTSRQRAKSALRTSAAEGEAPAPQQQQQPQQQQDKQTQTGSSSAVKRQPRRKQHASSPTPPPQQQAEPPHIHYTLSSAVGSYSDFNRCSVNLDEDVAGGAAAAAHHNGTPPGSSSNGCEPSTSGRGVNGTSSRNGSSRPVSDSAHDDVRGLVYGATVRFSDSAALRLRRRAMVVWDEAGPRKVLIVKKPVPAAAQTLADMAAWLQKRGLQVFVERSVHKTEFPHLQPFDPAEDQVDFAITLGGDGTVLHLASLFAEDSPLPPVMCFAMGTLGFLTPFDAAQFRSCLARVLAANRRPLYCTLRTRKRCAVMDADGKLRRVHHILNECVVDRGAFPSSVYLELYIDGSYVTSAEADGLIIATPSGSTAYSMSAGGSMVAPSVPCTLVTPLSPHSLSFRPLIIPENADLMIRLPENARSHARASFDGKWPLRIPKGCSVLFETSLCPLPLINIQNMDIDWYEGIVRKLKWNQSIRSVPSSGLEAAILQKATAAAAGTGSAQPGVSLGGLVSDLTAAAQNEAKVANWVEEALLERL